MAKMPCSKPFYFLDSNDTISLSRTGSLVKVPQFWATLLLYLPPELNVNRSRQFFDQAWPFVKFYDLVPIAEAYSVPNDEFYQSRQKSLHHDPAFPDADINVEGAWEIETGKKFIKVGVNDFGGDTNHIDLKWLKKYNLFSNSPGSSTVPNNHGTLVGGIIGARRNNNVGIAGISGGSGFDTSGVSLFNLQVLEPLTTDPYIVGTAVSTALTLASTQLISHDSLINLFPDYSNYFAVSDTGLGLHLINHSYGINYGSFGPSFPQAAVGDCKICYEAIEYSYRNGVINVAARGNETMAPIDAPTDSVYPSCVKDEMIISVSASGYNGQFKTYDNNNPLDPLGDNYMSMYGRNVDLMAPGTNAIIFSTDLTNSVTGQSFSSFNGTSASAPHVTGTVGLMLSHVNKPCPCEKNLTPEDVEYILQKTASQRNSLVLNGTTISTQGEYNYFSGYGMLDASKSLKAIEEPKNQIIHVTRKNPIIDSVLVAQNVTIHLYNPYTTIYSDSYQGSFSNTFNVDSLYRGFYNIMNGPYQWSPSIDKSYIVDIYKVSTTIDHSVETAHLTENTILKDAWIRNSSSIGWKLNTCIHDAGNLICDSIDVSQNVYFDTTATPTLQQAHLYTYVYKFKRIVENWNQVIFMQNMWYPCKPKDTEFAYSLYVYDSLATSVPEYPCAYLNTTNVKQTDKTEIFNVFPNPTCDVLNLTAEIMENEIITIDIFDLSGRNIQQIKKRQLAKGKNYFQIDLQDYQSGLYFVKVSNDNRTLLNKKFIKI